MTTMDDMYGDGSNHKVCKNCGLCITCGDCQCLNNNIVKKTKKMETETYCDWCGKEITSSMKLFQVQETDVCEECFKGTSLDEKNIILVNVTSRMNQNNK